MVPFSIPIRVRYYEADQMGIVHHAQYVRYLEVARIEWLRHLGLSYRDMENAGALLVIAQLEVKYRLPARFDDDLQVEVVLQRMTAIRIVLGYRILRPNDNAVICEASTTLACVDRAGQLCALPEAVRGLLPPDAPQSMRRGGP